MADLRAGESSRQQRGMCRGRGQESQPGRLSSGWGVGERSPSVSVVVGPQVACTGDGEMGHCGDIWMEEPRGGLGRTLVGL